MPRQAARAQGNIGGCQFALHQYRPALQSFLEAHRQAEAANDHSAAAIFDVNIASLYSELGELDAASEWIQDTIHRLNAQDRHFLPQILIQLATLRARQDRMPEARQLFYQGIDAADRAGDLALCANGWNRLGEEYLKRGELALAEPPLLEAYRVRKLNHLALDVSYRSLGRLRLEEGDLAVQATALLIALCNSPRSLRVGFPPGISIIIVDAYEWRRGVLQDAMADLRHRPSAWRVAGAGPHRPTMLRGWDRGMAERQAHRHAHEEGLRQLDAGFVDVQEVAVVQRLQAEVVELQVAVGLERRAELGQVELQQLLVEQLGLRRPS